MLQFITPIIMVTLSAVTFFFFTDPAYTEVKDLRTQQAEYNEALNNSKQLQAVREVLREKYNNFTPEDLQKISKLIPDNVDNIRLIIEIQSIAAKYNMVLTNVKFDAKKTGDKEQTLEEAAAARTTNKDYGTFDLEFSTQGSYENFVGFLTDLEKNLRIVDINGLGFSVTDTTSGQGRTGNKYDFKIKTYWLKN